MPTTVRPVPDELREAARLWREAGRPPQRGISWSVRTWTRTFPEHAAFLEELATLDNGVARADVIARCADAHTGPEAAQKAFLVAMIWGYGPAGYGAFRTQRVLSANEGAPQTLADVAKVARDAGGPTAFEWLAASGHRLRWLGVAFGTKYLYFCAANGVGQPALVLDRLVRWWLWEHCRWWLSMDWNVAQYRDYVNTLCAWSTQLDVAPGDVEMLMFRLQAAGDPAMLSPQSGQVVGAAPAAEQTAFGISEEAQALLDVLGEAGEQFATLPGGDPHDLEDFEYGLRHLRRIVLARGQG
jgi:hypothetical protein